MSLIGALNVGQSALAAQQAALQVTGNNIANAGNADYTRQTANLSPSVDQQIQPGMFIGTGVDLTSIQRQIDQALQDRLNGATSDNQAATTSQTWLGQVQSVFNELSDQDLSTQMSTFFNGWSDLANNPQDAGQRQVVLQDGATVAQTFNGIQSQLSGLQSSLNDQLKSQTVAADNLASQIATLNGQIVVAQGGSTGTANALLDQRDAEIKQLSQLVNVKTVAQPDGAMNVYIGSEPLVLGTTNRGLDTKTTTDATTGKLMTEIVFKQDGGTAPVTSGQLGAMMSVQGQVGDVMDQVNTLAGNLIFELNKLHSSGQGTEGFTTVTGTNTVADPTAALNTAAAGLPFTPTNGSFVVHVKDTATGLETSTLVQVDLDGLNNNDTTLNSLTSSLSAINGVSASIVGGKLQIGASNNTEKISFSQDSSGTLAALGINTFFSGSDARSIAVNQTVQQDTNLISAAQNGNSDDNQTAKAIAALESTDLAGLKGSTLKDSYQALITGIATSAATATSNANATQTVQQTLESQREALSGVSLDEEAVNLIRQQRAYQAAARLISAIDDMTKTLLAIT